MKLYMKQKVFSMGANFEVFDENEKRLFYSENPVFSWTIKTRVYDASTDRLFLYLYAKALSFRPTYYIESPTGMLLATLNAKLMTFVSIELNIESSIGPMVIHGNAWSGDFSIEHHDHVICQVHKTRFAMAPKYEIDILDEEHFDLLLGIVIALNIHINRLNSQAAAS